MAQPKKKRPRPRLTRAIVEGLRTVHSDAESMLEERGGHGEEHPEDENESLALDYLGSLIAWHVSSRRLRPR
jgi:hypothetical protein